MGRGGSKTSCRGMREVVGSFRWLNFEAAAADSLSSEEK